MLPLDKPFEFRPSIRVLCGTGQVERLGELANELTSELVGQSSGATGGSRVLLVTDQGIEAAGIAARVRDLLGAADCAVVSFDGVGENPTSAHVAQAADAARQHGGVDLIVGLGGGSAMDCAKGANFVLSNGGSMEDYQGFGKASRPMLPSIGVPTTAGTGSEAQSYALIGRAKSHQKMACGDLKARFTSVVLDPQLCHSAPRQVRAVAGMDALSHAVEALVTTAGSPLSRLYAGEAWRQLEASYGAVLDQDASQEVWTAMLWGAHLAGMAIETSMLGAAHALANPLTAAYGTTHGVAVGLVLPHVVRFNGAVAEALYTQLCPGGSAQVADQLETLRAKAGLPDRLSQCGVDEKDLPELAAEAAGQWTGGFNPRPLDRQALLGLYQQAF
jgi:alcohol dehydrogenase